MRREAWLALLILVPFAAGGCAAAALMPAAAVAYKGASKATEAARPITDSEEYYVGRAVAARILGKYKLDQNPKLTQYVNEVGDTVARKSSRPNPFRGYHFAVLDTQEINAFACPGGTIFITRGLIQTCKMKTSSRRCWPMRWATWPTRTASTPSARPAGPRSSPPWAPKPPSSTAAVAGTW